MGCHREADEVGGVPQIGIFLAGAGHNRHRDLGQIVVDDVVDLGTVHQLCRGIGGIAPET